MRVENFFLAEEWAPPQPAGAPLLLPDRSRGPTDPGYVLTWREYPYPGGSWETGEQRTGYVLALAPLAKSVWVVPDEQRPGEGCAVAVRNVTPAGAGRAERCTGHPEDYLSTAEWQLAQIGEKREVTSGAVRAGRRWTARPG